MFCANVFCRLYYHLFRQAYGPTQVSHDELRQRISAINNELRSAASAEDENFIVMSSDEVLVVAVCTPMMKRVHRMVKHSAELVFVDASGHMDRQNARVFILLTHSAAGGLPLGILILANEQCATIAAGFQLYMSLLDDTCFGGRGAAGPVVFMTDDCTSERTALHTVYPDATLLLCAFHILQAFWRFLWDNKTNVQKQHRQQLFSMLKTMLYSTSEDQLDTVFQQAVSKSVVQQHPKVLRHLQSLYSRRSEWALCCRLDLPVRSNNTNNYCESAMRVMKDKVLQRTKAFNVHQLVDFIVTRLDTHYQRRLVDAANNRLEANRTSRFFPKTAVDCKSIRQVNPDLYEVPSATVPDVVYLVDMAVGCCGCHKGNTGGPCKHQAAVMQTFNVASWNFLPVTDPDMRRTFYIVATGDTNPNSNWFASLTGAADAVSNTVLQSQQSDDYSEGLVAVANEVMQQQPDQLCLSADAELIAALRASFTKIENLYRLDPATYDAAVRSFCHQTSMASDSALQSALHCFGKYCGAAPALNTKRKLVALKSIGVQPTAVARRKMPVGGRKRCYLGRPPRSAFSAEHGYSVRVGDRRHVMLKRRAPHNLAAAVAVAEKLGATHSEK